MSSSLALLRDALERLALRTNGSASANPYFIPALWCPPHSTNGVVSLTNPAHFFVDLIDSLLSRHHAHRHTNDDAASPVVYSMLIRHATAFAHDDACWDEVIHSMFTVDGWRTTGTFVKSIALLPYIASLGVNTLYVLPVQQPSSVHRKGSLGSVFALRNVEKVDESLAETVIDVSPDDQFRAFVEAAHLLGIRVVCEFALRTVGRDCEWIEEHPEWFYWMRHEVSLSPEANCLRPPAFSLKDLDRIARQVDDKNWKQLPAPSHDYRARFCDTPTKVERLMDGSYMGKCGEISCSVPGAFADYPPDDTQPLWDDVTYLKLHIHPHFNYVAYNTIRMYDEELRSADRINTSLWEKLESIIPSFIRRFDIDGAVLDMSHALPNELRSRIIVAARSEKSDFLMIEENFDRDELSTHLGFNAVLGNVWWHAASMESLRRFADELKDDHSSIPFFATLDTHNTPRCAQRLVLSDLREAFALTVSLPHGIPLILAGSEFGECLPMNTGLLFDDDEMRLYPPSRLALFSAVRMKWEAADLGILKAVRDLLHR